MQLDTLQRKINTLKADLTSVISNVGQGGLTEYLKGVVTQLDAVVIGMQKMSPATIELTGSITKLVLIMVMLSKITKVFFDSFAVEKIYAAVTAIRATTTATEGLSIAMKTLGKAGPMLIITTILTGLVYALDSYTESVGRAEQAEKQAMANKQDSIALYNQQLETMQKQNEFSDAMYASYVKLNNIVNTSEEGSKKYETALKNRQATEEQLTTVLGEAAVQRIKAAGWTQEAYDTEAQHFKDAQAVKKKEIADLNKQLTAAAREEINRLTQEVEGYWKDADNFGESLKEKAKYLSWWQSLQAKYYNWMASNADTDAENAEKKLSRAKEMQSQYEEGTTAYESVGNMINVAQKELDDANKAKDEYDTKVNDIFGEGAKDLEGQLLGAKKRLADLQTNGLGLVDFSGSLPGGSNVDETEKKGKGRNASQPTDVTEQLEQKLDKARYNQIVDAAVVSNNKFSESLSRIDDMSKRLGASYELLDSKLGAYKNNMSSLVSTSQKMREQLQSDIEKLNQLASGQGITVTMNGGNGSAESTAMNFLMSQGYSPEFSAGLVGNLMTESGMNPSINAYDGSGSFGIGQWLGGRKQALTEFANANNSDINDLNTQLAFIVKELQTTESGSLSKVMNSGAKTPEEFAYAISKYYERPAWAENPDRQKNARDIMGQYQSGSLGGQPIEVSVTLPEGFLASKGIGKQDWKDMSTDAKKQLIEENKEQVADAKLIVNHLNQINEEQKKISEYDKKIVEERKKEYEIILSGIKDVSEYQNKQSELIKRGQIATLGVYGNDYTTAKYNQYDLERKMAISNAQMEQYKLKGIDIFTDSQANADRIKNLELKAQVQKEREFTIPEAEYKKTLSDLEYERSMSKLKYPGKSIPDEYGTQMSNVDYYTNKVKALNTLMEEMRKEDIFATQTEGYRKYELELKQAQKDMNDAIEEPNKKMKESTMEVMDSILLKGEGFHKTFKKLWEQLAEEALRAMMGLQTGSNSLFGQLLSNTGKWFGGGKQKQATQTSDYMEGVGSSLLGGILNSSSSKSSSTMDNSFGFTSLFDKYGKSNEDQTYFDNSNMSNAAKEAMKKKSGLPTSNGGNSWQSYFGLLQNAGSLFGWFANGGETNGPSIAGEDGKEVVIPVEKNTQNSVALLNHAANKLGVNYSGKQLTPNINTKTSDNATKMIAQNTTSMEQTNKILATQNTILTNILNKNYENGKQGGNMTVVNNQQSDSDLYNQMQRMQTKGYNVLGSSS